MTTLERIEEGHRRFLQSKMFKRFLEAKSIPSRLERIAKEFKEKGIVVSATILEQRREG